MPTVGASLRGMPASCRCPCQMFPTHPNLQVFPYLQLGKREATTGAHATVVLEGRATHHRPQTVDWARGELGGLLVAGIASAQLATGLQQKRMVRKGVHLSHCTTGATALKSRGVRGELPGQSARGHGAASPCGSLRVFSSCHEILMKTIGFSRLCWICWLCLIVILWQLLSFVSDLKKRKSLAMVQIHPVFACRSVALFPGLAWVKLGRRLEENALANARKARY